MVLVRKMKRVGRSVTFAWIVKKVSEQQTDVYPTQAMSTGAMTEYLVPIAILINSIFAVFIAAGGWSNRKESRDHSKKG